MSDVAFSDSNKDELIARMQRDPALVVEFIQSHSDLSERRQLYKLAQRTFGVSTFEGRDLDAVILVVRAGIDEGLRQSGAETGPEAAGDLKNFSNVLAFNLAADLAECWPEDTLLRATRHFEAGLAAAMDCLRWRVELLKGPYPFSIAWWARGMHEMSLGMFTASAESFDRALDFGIQAAKTVGHEHDVETDFNVVLNRGYGGWARKLGGSRLGDEQFTNACERFSRIAATGEGEAKADAAFGLAQLRCIEERISADRGANALPV